jgi:phosphoadenosine phosphosulfate reductase
MSAIDLYARATPGFDDRVAQAVVRLQQAAERQAGCIVQATSLGAEDMVVTDLIARHRLPIAIATLDTGALHPETVGLIDTITRRYGLLVEVFRPAEAAVVQFVRQHGPEAMYRSLELRKACCGVRKMEPLARMLAGRSAWVTGLRREQSNARGEVPVEDRDDAGRLKLNPLADWSWHDVWHYIASHQVPYNPLHDQFMPSIGCAPCTRAIAVGEDFRAGRWWWESESAKECGLHVRQPDAATADEQVSILGERA